MKETEIQKLKKEVERLKREEEIRKWGLRKTNEAVKILYRDLEKKNQELQKLDQLKSDFVSMVSHELKTPLAISTEGIDLVMEGVSGPLNDKQQGLLKSSKDNLVRLNAIVTDLLDIAKIEAGKITLKRRLVDLKVILKEFLDSYQKVLAKKKQKLTMQLPVDGILLYIDMDKVIQVITNLLNNAHKFTPECGTIEFEVIMRESDILFSVKDSGIGISKKDIGRLFKKFEQLDYTPEAGPKGTGLGLSICKALVELHDGQIWVESEFHEGTTFFFTLPNYKTVKINFDKYMDKVLHEANANNESVAFMMLYLSNLDALKKKYGVSTIMNIMNHLLMGFGKILSRSSDTFIFYELHTIYTMLPQTERTGGFSVICRLKEEFKKCALPIKDRSELELKFGLAVFPLDAEDRKGLVRVSFEEVMKTKHILVVDDQPQVGRILKFRLKGEDLDIEWACDGPKALSMINERIPDLIVLDLVMPKMNGYEVWGRLKENPVTASIPVVILAHDEGARVKRQYQAFDSITIISKTRGYNNLISAIKNIL